MQPPPRPVDIIWRAPLVPLGLVLTAGIVVDRYFAVSFLFSLGAALACLLAWIFAGWSSQARLSLVYLWAGCASLGAAYHHWSRHEVAAADIRHFAAIEPQPARLRGVLHGQPNFVRGDDDNPLRTIPARSSTRFVLRASHLKDAADWCAVGGLVQVVVPAKVHTVHVGDRLEIVGRLSLPQAPANPGEFDYAAFLKDQGIGAVLYVPASDEGVTQLARGWPGSLFGWLAVVRGWGQDVIARNLPENYQGLAGALLLGEGSRMTGDDWEKYLRTGVIHVLAISGQHLLVLAGFFWFVLRLGRCQRRHGALAIALVLVGYALLTGGRPPVMRAAWAVCVYCGGMFLRRPVLPANAFALAWIGVALANPADLFNTGCQLSFLAVAVLFWGIGRWERPALNPLQQVIDESRPLALNLLMTYGRWIGWFYVVNAAVWIAVTPLVAARYHLVSPVAVVIGAPMVLLSSLALITGFMLLLTAPLGLSPVFALPTHWLLAGCDWLVGLGARLPGAYFFVTDVPAWWLWLFYLGLFAFLTLAWCRARAVVVIPVLGIWLALGLVLEFWPHRPDGFRCTFVAVGHGGCTVLETADGRVLVYDAGAITGPDVTRRQIAPFLWNRGIRRIDDLLISHGDLDHFNGVVALLERFSVRQVTLTPSFADRSSPGVRRTMDVLNQRGQATRIVKAGDLLEPGEPRLEVLHPPPEGPEGNENSRSLVLLIRSKDLAILLTGDLEGTGLARVLSLPRFPIDVLMAPHHGSKTANTPEMAKWAAPSLVISSQGAPRGNPKTVLPYEAAGARFLTTWRHGTITLRKEEGRWVAETFKSKQKLEVRK